MEGADVGLQRFERKLEGLVGNTFARVFGGSVVPQEVAQALQRLLQDADARSEVARIGRALVEHGRGALPRTLAMIAPDLPVPPVAR